MPAIAQKAKALIACWDRNREKEEEIIAKSEACISDTYKLLE